MEKLNISKLDIGSRIYAVFGPNTGGYNDMAYYNWLFSRGYSLEQVYKLRYGKA